MISVVFSLFPGAAVWLITHSPRHGLEAAGSFAFMFGLLVSLSFLAKKYLPASIERRIQHSRPRNFLELLILSVVLLPTSLGWNYPLIERRYVLLAGVIAFLAVMFVPSAKRAEKAAPPIDSPHASH